ncbi:MAG: hypothetical protein ACE1ZZ_00815 [Dehalococcoidia bacterium]
MADVSLVRENTALVIVDFHWGRAASGVILRYGADADYGLIVVGRLRRPGCWDARVFAASGVSMAGSGGQSAGGL